MALLDPQALAAAAETMSPSFFYVLEGEPTLRGEANPGRPSSNDATADSVFAAGTAWIVQSEEECCRKLLSTPESLLGVMLRMPQLSLQGCILRMVANFCRNTQDASDVLAGPAVEAMCGVLKNVCIRSGSQHDNSGMAPPVSDPWHVSGPPLSCCVLLLIIGLPGSVTDNRHAGTPADTTCQRADPCLRPS